MPLGAVAAAANRRDDGLLAATLDTLTVVGGLPAHPVVHLDAGDDDQPCRQALAARGMLGEIATRGVPAPIQASRRCRSSAPTPGATRTASCAGAPNAAGRWWSSGWPWPTPPSWVSGWSAVPGPATAGSTAPAAHEADWRSPVARWRRLPPGRPTATVAAGVVVRCPGEPGGSGLRGRLRRSATLHT